MSTTIVWVIVCIVALIVGCLAGYIFRKTVGEKGYRKRQGHRQKMSIVKITEIA